jgi:membrane-associated phospholipid phosphatase
MPVMATVAFVLLYKTTLRTVGAVLLALAAATGWARINVSVQFPCDVVAGFPVAGVLAGVCVAVQHALRWANGLAADQRIRSAGYSERS